MARPTLTRIDRPSGYAPRQQGATQSAQVHASLDVRTGKSSAEHFADALGLANETAQPFIKQKVAEKAADQTTQGMTDARNGIIDEKRAAEDEYYARGQKRALVDRATLDAKNEWKQRYETGEVDRTNTDTVRADFNQYMQEKLGAFLSDPEAARWAAERLVPFEAQTMDALQKEQAEQFKLDAQGVAGDSMRDDREAGRPINFEAAKEHLIGAGYTRGEATQIAVTMLANMAVEDGDPDLLDQIPVTWPDGTPGPRAVPALLEKINEAEYYATTKMLKNDRDAQTAREKAAEPVVAEATKAAAQGNEAAVIRMLNPLLDAGAISRSDYASLVNFARGTVDRYRDDAIDARVVTDYRARLARGEFPTRTAALAEAARILPPGSAGGRAAMSLADDVESSFRSREKEDAPMAKPYRRNLEARAAQLTSMGDPERAADALLLYDRQINENKTPEEAFAAAKAYLDSTEMPAPSAAPGTSRKVGNATVTALN